MNNNTSDVLIVGAGPAGSMAALMLARAGVRVIVLEKAVFPREKTCGGFLSPKAIRLLSDHDVRVIDTIPHTEVEEVNIRSQDGRGFSCSMGKGRRAIGVTRSAFDHALVQDAQKAGVEFRFGITAREVVPESHSVQLNGISDSGSARFTCRFLIAAGGRNCTIRRQLSGPAPSDHRAGVSFHYPAHGEPPWPASIHAFRGGYAGVLTLGVNIVNLCFVIDTRLIQETRGVPEKLLALGPFTNSFLAERFSDRKWCEGPFITIPIFVPHVQSPHPRVLYAGDASGFVEPLTGYGIYKALADGIACANHTIALLNNKHTNDSPINKSMSAPHPPDEDILRYIHASSMAGSLEDDIARLGNHPMIARNLVRLIYSPNPTAIPLARMILKAFLPSH